MSEADQKQRLLFLGALLVFVGLVSGAAIPAMATQRLGLSAHLAAVQGGMLVMIVGCAWERLRLTESQSRLTFATTVFSNWALFVALQLAALFGTSRSTPIAGAGTSGSAAQELIVDVVLYAGAGTAFVAVGLVAWGLRPSAT